MTGLIVFNIIAFIIMFFLVTTITYFLTVRHKVIIMILEVVCVGLLSVRAFLIGG